MLRSRSPRTSPSVGAFVADRDRLYGFVPPYATLTPTDRDRLLPALRRAAENFGPEGSVRWSPPHSLLRVVAHIEAKPAPAAHARLQLFSLSRSCSSRRTHTFLRPTET